MKATRTGICQWCNRRQMLPGGRLADHGYTIRHGYQQGVCRGAGHLPYEQSCALIVESIKWATANTTRLRDLGAALRAVTTGRACSMQVYHPNLSSRSRGAVYLWVDGTIEGDGFDAAFVHGSPARPMRERLHKGCKPGEVLAIILRQERADAFDRHADSDEEYAKAQQIRVDAWKPAELTPR